VSSNSKYTLENASCVLLLIHRPTVAINKLKFVKKNNLLRVNISHKLFLTGALLVDVLITPMCMVRITKCCYVLFGWSSGQYLLGSRTSFDMRTAYENHINLPLW